MPAAWSSSTSARRTKSRSTARRNASVSRAVSCTGHATKVSSVRKRPSVTKRCRCGCQLAREPCVYRQATMPTASSRSPVRGRMAAVTVRAATRAISPNRRRRYRQYARSRLGMVSTTCRCGTGARRVVSNHCVQIARRLGRAAPAEVATLAREREQVLVRAGIAAEAGEPVLEDATRQELVGDPRDDGAPRAVLLSESFVVDRLQAVQMVRHQPKERRCLGPSGLVDSTRLRCRVGHARSETGERRACARLGPGPSPFRCATGCFDATSARRGPNDAYCRRASSEARSARIVLERPPQKLALRL